MSIGELSLNDYRNDICKACYRNKPKFGFFQCETCIKLGLRQMNGRQISKVREIVPFCLAGVGEMPIFIRDKENGRFKREVKSYKRGLENAKS